VRAVQRKLARAAYPPAPPLQAADLLVVVARCGFLFSWVARWITLDAIQRRVPHLTVIPLLFLTMFLGELVLWGLFCPCTCSSAQPERAGTRAMCATQHAAQVRLGSCPTLGCVRCWAASRLRARARRREANRPRGELSGTSTLRGPRSAHVGVVLLQRVAVTLCCSIGRPRSGWRAAGVTRRGKRVEDAGAAGQLPREHFKSAVRTTLFCRRRYWPGCGQRAQVVVVCLSLCVNSAAEGHPLRGLLSARPSSRSSEETTMLASRRRQPPWALLGGGGGLFATLLLTQWPSAAAQPSNALQALQHRRYADGAT
jgi:hypothetical protein